MHDPDKTESPAGRASTVEVELGIDPKRANRNLLIFLISFALFLVFIDSTINYSGWIGVGGLRRMANIAREDGLGTWFMATQTLATGIIVFFIYLTVRSVSEASRKVAAGWLVISLFIVFMAIDDAAQIHERFGSAFRHYAEKSGAGSLPGRLLDFFPSYPWQIIVLPVFAVLGVFMLVFLWQQLSDETGRALLILALGCFFLALFIDFIEGLEPEHRLNFFTAVIDNTALSEDAVRHYAKVIEEFLEMLGMTLLLSMFFTHLAFAANSIKLTFLQKAAPASG